MNGDFILIYMVEPLLSGIILGLIFITVFGLFFTAFLQYLRSENDLKS